MFYNAENTKDYLIGFIQGATFIGCIWILWILL